MSVLKHHPIPPGLEIDIAKAIFDKWQFYATRGYTTVTELVYSTNSDIVSLHKNHPAFPGPPHAFNLLASRQLLLVLIDMIQIEFWERALYHS